MKATPEVIEAVKSAIAKYDRAIFEVENTEMDLFAYKAALEEKKMSCGLCDFFSHYNFEIKSEIYEYLELPFARHLTVIPLCSISKEMLIAALKCRLYYMKKYIRRQELADAGLMRIS